jgi:hypothetical protein
MAIPPTTPSCCWACCCTATASACAPPGSSNAAARRTSPSACSQATTPPDHVTIARFRARHEHALAGFLVESLKLCAAAGMVKVGLVALDGTKLAGNTADKANRTLDRLNAEVAEILRQAADADQREDLEHGQARGDELPEALASKAGGLARLRQAKARLEAEAAHRAQHLAQRAAASAAAAANVTDPDSRLHTRKGRVQGYNAQAAPPSSSSTPCSRRPPRR